MNTIIHKMYNQYTSINLHHTGSIKGTISIYTIQTRQGSVSRAAQQYKAAQAAQDREARAGQVGLDRAAR